MSRRTSAPLSTTQYDITSYFQPQEPKPQYEHNFNIPTLKSTATSECTETTTSPNTNNPVHDDIRNKDGTLFLSDEPTYTNNESWGDQLDEKLSYITRVYFHNINGILYQKSWDKWKEIVDMINKHKVDVAGFVETNINWNPTNCNTAKSILRTRNKHVVMTNTHSDDPTTGTYQPGGMSLIMQNNLIGAIDSTGNDS